MGDLVKGLLVISILMSFVIAAVAALVLLLNFMISLLAITINVGVVRDLHGLIAIWLPFNMSAVWYIFTTAAFLFLGYRLGMVFYTWLNRLFGKA